MRGDAFGVCVAQRPFFLFICWLHFIKDGGKLEHSNAVPGDFVFKQSFYYRSKEPPETSWRVFMRCIPRRVFEKDTEMSQACRVIIINSGISGTVVFLLLMRSVFSTPVEILV